MAMPSRKMLLRSTPTPSHWEAREKVLLVFSVYPNIRCSVCVSVCVGGSPHEGCDGPSATSLTKLQGPSIDVEVL